MAIIVLEFQTSPQTLYIQTQSIKTTTHEACLQSCRTSYKKSHYKCDKKYVCVRIYISGKYISNEGLASSSTTAIRIEINDWIWQDERIRSSFFTVECLLALVVRFV